MDDINLELEKNEKDLLKINKSLEVNKLKMIEEITNSNIKEELDKTIETDFDKNDLLINTKKSNKLLDFFRKMFKLFT